MPPGFPRRVKRVRKSRVPWSRRAPYLHGAPTAAEMLPRRSSLRSVPTPALPPNAHPVLKVLPASRPAYSPAAFRSAGPPLGPRRLRTRKLPVSTPRSPARGSAVRSRASSFPQIPATSPAHAATRRPVFRAAAPALPLGLDTSPCVLSSGRPSRWQISHLRKASALPFSLGKAPESPSHWIGVRLLSY